MGRPSARGPRLEGRRGEVPVEAGLDAAVELLVQHDGALRLPGVRMDGGAVGEAEGGGVDVQRRGQEPLTAVRGAVLEVADDDHVRRRHEGVVLLRRREVRGGRAEPLLDPAYDGALCPAAGVVRRLALREPLDSGETLHLESAGDRLELARVHLCKNNLLLRKGFLQIQGRLSIMRPELLAVSWIAAFEFKK